MNEVKLKDYVRRLAALVPGGTDGLIDALHRKDWKLVELYTIRIKARYKDREVEKAADIILIRTQGYPS